MTDQPQYPMVEVYVCSDPAAKSDDPILTMERDQGNRWWHVLGGKPVRQASELEQLLVLNQSAWLKWFQREILDV